jgi:hypothetical protein
LALMTAWPLKYPRPVALVGFAFTGAVTFFFYRLTFVLVAGVAYTSFPRCATGPEQCGPCRQTSRRRPPLGPDAEDLIQKSSSQHSKISAVSIDPAPVWWTPLGRSHLPLCSVSNAGKKLKNLSYE